MHTRTIKCLIVSGNNNVFTSSGHPPCTVRIGDDALFFTYDNQEDHIMSKLQYTDDELLHTVCVNVV